MMIKIGDKFLNQNKSWACIVVDGKFQDVYTNWDFKISEFLVSSFFRINEYGCQIDYIKEYYPIKILDLF